MKFPVSNFARLAAVTMLAACALLNGCSTVATPRDVVRGRGYKPENVFVNANALPQNVRRVTVLPLICDASDYDLTAGCTALQSVLVNEIIKTKKFEVVCSDADFVKTRTGRTDWSAEDALPPEFFNVLRDGSACDAVLFCRLTVYRPFPPLAIGWRMRLVDAQTRRTLWSADEVFDGGQQPVEDGARRHQLTQERDPSGAPDVWFVQNSPAKFGGYTAACLLATLPPR